jgi:tetratricopeptide (TPR) repeat protein
MIKKQIFYVVSAILLCSSYNTLAQTEPEDIALDTKQFEESFYESLKHKGMENYDKAIYELEKCDNLQPNNEAVIFELAKNYYFLKKYKEAFDNFEKVTQINPKNRWAWHGMYDVCYDTRDYNRAIDIVEKLTEFKEEYKDDLLSLYMNTQQYDKALTLINDLNDRFGTTDMRAMYKKQILQDARYQGSEKENLISQIKKNPKEENNYIQLIYLYSQSNQEEKALEIAKQLEKEIPTSDWAQVSLFKFHLNNNEGEKAVKAMNIALKSDKIDKKIKHRILNEFLIFSKNNPTFEKDLDKAISYFDNDKEIKVAKEIGKFYQAKNNFIKATKYYEMHLKGTNDDVETISLLLECYRQNNDFQKMATFSEEQMQLFPTQPDFYFYNGLANNNLNKFKKAKDALETGIDFVVDNPALEINFNLQLSQAYNGLGDTKKKELYATKANELLKKQKK